MVSIIKSRFGYIKGYFKNLIFTQIFLSYICAVLFAYFSVNYLFLFGIILAFWCLTDPKKRKVLLFFWLIFCVLGIVRFNRCYGPEKTEKITDNYSQNLNTLEIIEKVKYDYGTQFIAKSQGIEGKILVRSPKIEYGLECGGILSGNFYLEEPPTFETFNYKEYLEINGIYYQVDLSNYEYIQNDQNYSPCFLKNKLTNSLKKNIPSNQSSLIAGILWGEDGDFSKEYKNNLQKTGTSHVVAVSGYNVSILVLLGLKLTKFLPRKYVVVFLGISLLIFLYLVGFDNLPAFRAVVMGGVVLFMKSFGTKIHLIDLLAVACLIILMINPLGFKTISFQLSFFALLGIVGFTDTIKRRLKNLPFLQEELSATLSAIIFTTPITFYNFNTISVIAPVVNMFILPIVPILMLLGFLQLVLSVISPDLATLSAYAIFPFFRYFEWVLEAFGSWQYSLYEFKGSVPKEIWAVYLAAVIISIEINYRKYIKERRSY